MCAEFSTAHSLDDVFGISVFVSLIRGTKSRVVFTGVTAAASGITFKHVSAPGKKYIVEYLSVVVALVDYSNDRALNNRFISIKEDESQYREQ